MYEPLPARGMTRPTTGAQSALPSFRSCSVVSTSGTLLGSALGPAIDAAAAVIRLGLGPTKGFENDVGRRTNVRCLGLGFVEKWRNISKADVHAVLADYRGHLLWQNALHHACHRVALRDVAACYPEAKHHTVGYHWVAGIKRPPTSGIAAIDVLLRNRVCGTVRLYGFGATPGPDVPYHYFRMAGARMTEMPAMRKYSLMRDSGGHDFGAEHAWLTRTSSILNSPDITAGRQIREITLRDLLREEERAGGPDAPLTRGELRQDRTIRGLGGLQLTGLAIAKNQTTESTCDYRLCDVQRIQ